MRQQVNYPSAANEAPDQSGFTAATLTFDLNAIRNWTQIDEDLLDDTDLTRLLQPMVGRFEAYCGIALRNVRSQVRFINPNAVRPVVLPGFAVGHFDLAYEGATASLSGLEFDGWGVRKDMLVYPPSDGWTGSLTATYERGVTDNDPLPDELLIAFASEVRRVRDGLEGYGKVVKSYLAPFRLL